MDILQRVPVEEWTLLRDSLKRNWPAYACVSSGKSDKERHYSYVRNAINWKTKDPSVKIDFYCPNGKIDAGVFIGIERLGTVSLILFAFDESKDLLREILCKTNQIDWSDTFQCTIVHENIIDTLKTFLEETGKNKGCTNFSVFDHYVYYLPKEKWPKMKVVVPEECVLKRIDETYVPLVHSLWPHRDTQHPEKTLELLTTIARLNGGYGLFLKEDNSLVSWIFQCNFGCLGTMQTLEEYKRKGYGKCVAHAQIKHLVEKEGVDLTIIIVQSNLPPQKLCELIGSKRVATAAWVLINP